LASSCRPGPSTSAPIRSALATMNQT
jgi:hypothetical protein